MRDPCAVLSATTMDHSEGGWADKAFQLVGGRERGQREYERFKRMPRAARREAYRALERQVGGSADAPQQSEQEEPTQQPGGEGSHGSGSSSSCMLHDSSQS